MLCSSHGRWSNSPTWKFTPGSRGASARRASDPHVWRDSGALPVDAEAREAVAQEIDQIAAITHPGIEHPRAVIEAALQNLIEEVDVDLAELGSEVGAGRRLHDAGSYTWGVAVRLKAGTAPDGGMQRPASLA